MLKRIDNFGTALFYQEFTFSTYRKWLASDNLNTHSVAIGSSESDRPIGMALARILPEDRSAQVLSVFVTPTHRCQGIGTKLLIRTETELVLRGCKNIAMSYTAGQLSTPALEHLLQKCDWTPPQVNQLICKCDRRTLNAPWLHGKYCLPTSFTIFPWRDITPSERLAILQSQETERWIPPDLIPFQYEENLEPLNSLGLRYQGRVVGWLLTHRTAPDTIRYTCSFIKQELQVMGRLIPLYIEAVKRQATAMPDSKVTWAVPIAHTSMIRFVKKYLSPYLISLEESKSSFKVLTDTRATMLPGLE